MLFKRKEFLQIGSLATVSLLMPKFLKALEKPRYLLQRKKNDKY
jgi:hypothetical protein